MSTAKKNAKQKKMYSTTHFLPIASLLVLFIFAHQIWFDPFAVVSNGDWTYFYPEALRTLQWGSWMSTFLFGDINFYPLRLLVSVVGQVVVQAGLNEQVVNMLLFFLPITLMGPASIYLLLHRFSSNRLASFLGSLFYLFNTFILVNSSAAYPIILVYAFMPLVFLLFDRMISNFSFFNGLLFVFVTSVLAFYELRYVFLILLVLVAYFVYKFFIVNKSIISMKFFRKNLTTLLTLFLITTTLNFYIIMFSFSNSMQLALQTGVASRSLIKPGWLFIENAMTTFYPFWTGNQPTMFFSQPVRWIFWVIPLYVFLSILFKKRNILILFFIFIASIAVFFGKGPSEPLGGIYEWAYYNLPIFSYFRESSKFWFIILLTYSILMTYFITYTFEIIRNKKIPIALSHVLQFIVIIPLLIVIAISIRPALSKDLGPGYYSIEITKELVALKDMFTNDSAFHRVLQVPQLSRYVYFSETHPRTTYVELPDTIRTLSPSVLRLLGVKYLVLSNDPFYEVFPGNSPRDTYIGALTKESGLIEINKKEIGEIKLYKNSKGSVPHIYTTGELAFIDGDLSNLENIVPHLGNKQNDIIFRNNREEYNSTVVNSYLKETSTNEFYVTRCEKCLENVASQTAQFNFIHVDEKSLANLYIVNYGIKHITASVNNKKYDLVSNNGLLLSEGTMLKKGDNKIEVYYENQTTTYDKEFEFMVNKNMEFEIELNNIKDYISYNVSFEYKISPDLETNFTFKQDTDPYFQYMQYKPGGMNWRAFNSSLTSDGEWHELSMSFKAPFGSKNAKLNFSPMEIKNKENMIQVKNIKIVVTTTPELVFKIQKNTDKNYLRPPSIVYQTINPTRHIVQVKDAISPYVLVFSEKYNPFWKATVVNSETVFRNQEKAIATDISWVKEMPAQNLYDVNHLLKSDGNEVSKDNHFMINSYANAWLIDKKGSYTIELNFEPQKVFILSVIVSAGACLSTFALILFLLIQRIMKKGSPMYKFMVRK